MTSVIEVNPAPTAPRPGLLCRRVWKTAATIGIALAALSPGCRSAPPAGPGAAERLTRIEARLERLEAQIGELAAALELPGVLPPPPRRVEGLEIGASPAKGPEDAPVTIIEFADFECPFSAAAAPTMERLLAAYPRQVRRVFKHYPMPFHKQAIAAHRAAAAAAEAGKFWEMHRLLFTRQAELDPASLRAHAGSLGLDPEVFDAAAASEESLQAILADRELARKVGVVGVPAFFINGRLIAGPQPFEVFSRAVEEELAARPGER